MKTSFILATIVPDLSLEEKKAMLETFSLPNFLLEGLQSYWLALLASLVVLICIGFCFSGCDMTATPHKVAVVVRWFSLPVAIWGLTDSWMLIRSFPFDIIWAWFDLFASLTALGLIIVMIVLVFLVGIVVLRTPMAASMSQLVVTMFVVVAVLTDWFILPLFMSPILIPK